MTRDSFISRRGQLVLFIMLGIGLMGFVVGLYVDRARTWSSVLQNALYFLTLSLGALVFIAINRVANAGWDTTIRRVPEAMLSYLPLGALAMLALFFGREDVYQGLGAIYGY